MILSEDGSAQNATEHLATRIFRLKYPSDGSLRLVFPINHWQGIVRQLAARHKLLQ